MWKFLKIPWVELEFSVNLKNWLLVEENLKYACDQGYKLDQFLSKLCIPNYKKNCDQLWIKN